MQQIYKEIDVINFYRNNWYNIAGIACLSLAFVMGFWSYLFSTIQIILIYSLMALLAHQFEEYVLPGGAPLVLNTAFYGEKKAYDRFPGNKQNCMIVNTLAYPFYILPIYIPEQIWLGLATMYFGFFQVVGHGIIMNIRGKTWYNPGLATAVFLHLPIGIYYIQYVNKNYSVTCSDYLLSAFAFVIALVVIVVLPVQLLKNPHSPYPFSPEELSKFSMLKKYIAKGVIKID